jgi:hypothetical protein
MDSKLYIEWRKRLEKWVVEYRGQDLARFNAKGEAEEWVQRNYPNHGYETERVRVRENSPKGAKVGQWL